MNNIKQLVSIVTPSYNQGEYIEETILSIIKQDYPLIEHIIIDAGSEDNTHEILKKYEKKYNMIWISEPDNGQSDAVNKGFKIAKGEIVGWLNSDDVYFSKNVISFVVDQFNKDETDHVLYGDSVTIDQNSYIRRVNRSIDWNYSILLFGCSYIPQPGTFYRNNVIVNEKLDVNLNFAMDLEYWLRLGKKYNFRHLHKLLAADRLHIECKRMDQKSIGAYRMESRNVREKYGLKYNIIYYVIHFSLAFYFLVINRILGLKDIARLRRVSDFAFNAKLNNSFKMLRNQIDPSIELNYLLALLSIKR
jgi:glycosyltransferase involved in cell wall biosynthesis